WQSLYGTVTLRQFDRGDGVLVLTDTRPGAAEFQRRLRGLEREVYLYCDSGRSLRTIAAHTAALEGIEPRDVAALKNMLDGWVAGRIMAYVDDRYLSLALWAPSGDGD
ncbi:MAG TPA: hypothetical protein VMY37_34715, partial [Thermoguttaceae bacterium]|nr:hypothetical protein [Thermoguttaceae bacterium]